MSLIFSPYLKYYRAKRPVNIPSIKMSEANKKSSLQWFVVLRFSSPISPFVRFDASQWMTQKNKTNVSDISL